MSKYLIAIMLKKFGIKFFSVVKNGYIAIDISSVTLDQCSLLLKFASFLAMFNPITRKAGYTHAWFDNEYPEGFSKDQWCYPPPASIDNFIHCTDPKAHFYTGLEHDELVKAANDLVQQTHHDLELSPMTECLRYLVAKNKITDDIANLSQKSQENEIHRIDPRLVSFSRPAVSVSLDGVVCGMTRCYSQECQNNRRHAVEFQILICKWKDTEEYWDSHYAPWVSASIHAPEGSNS